MTPTEHAPSFFPRCGWKKSSTLFFSQAPGKKLGELSKFFFSAPKLFFHIRYKEKNLVEKKVDNNL